MTPEQKAILIELRQLCQAHNVTIEEKGPGHYHLQGACLVNYYPFSKTRTAFTAGRPSVKRVASLDAVLMALETPPEAPPPADYFTIFGRPVSEAEFRAHEMPKGDGLPWDVKDSQDDKTGV